MCIRPLWKSGLHKDKIQKRREEYTAAIKLMVLYLGVSCKTPVNLSYA